MIEPARINPVVEVLQRNGIPLILAGGTNSCPGTPEAAVIGFGKDADSDAIQRVLDGAR